MEISGKTAIVTGAASGIGLSATIDINWSIFRFSGTRTFGIAPDKRPSAAKRMGERDRFATASPTSTPRLSAVDTASAGRTIRV
jgi:hypothetical protein